MCSGDQSLISVMKSTYLKPPPHIPAAHVHGWDRVTVAIDRAAPLKHIRELSNACGGGAKLTVQTLKHNPVWKAKLDLFQPSPDAIDMLLDEYLADQIAAMVTYVEIAWDLIFSTPAQAQAYQVWFLERASMRHQRDRALLNRRTAYFSRRSAKATGKRGAVGVAYSDRPSKLSSKHSGRDCLHVEIRITGSKAAAAVGIASASDLHHFDHCQFWTRVIRLLEPPKATDLGRLLGLEDQREVSGSALRKRAKKFIAECSADGQFFMHNAIRKNRALTRRFAVIALGSVMPIAGDAD